jgi:hypothetical protein
VDLSKIKQSLGIVFEWGVFDMWSSLSHTHTHPAASSVSQQQVMVWRGGDSFLTLLPQIPNFATQVQFHEVHLP